MHVLKCECWVLSDPWLVYFALLCVYRFIYGLLKENSEHESKTVEIWNWLVCCSIQGVFWRSQLYIDQPQFLKFNISVQKDALVGVYGRKGLPPSHTQVGHTNTCMCNYTFIHLCILSKFHEFSTAKLFIVYIFSYMIISENESIILKAMHPT